MKVALGAGAGKQDELKESKSAFSLNILTDTHTATSTHACPEHHRPLTHLNPVTPALSLLSHERERERERERAHVNTVPILPQC
jgi:hypothetical protein